MQEVKCFKLSNSGYCIMEETLIVLLQSDHEGKVTEKVILNRDLVDLFDKIDIEAIKKKEKELPF